ncbi:heme-binding protein 2-like [Tubulanus polymorphus]|uniref:heme-binding protein 2-like n=1 Tax=Tubulanus polymorphus TaxID=672921 RepID=UPI003DA38FD2
MMKTILLLVGVSALVLLTARCEAKVINMDQNEIERHQVSWTPPKFCNGLSCPEYDVVKKTDDYELRRYKQSKWVSTQLVGIDYGMSAMRTMFMRLFNYIQGENVAKQKIPMTCPVTTRFIPGAGPACESNFTMSFYLPNPASAPTNKDVFLSELPETLVYVRQFGGYILRFSTWVEEAHKLAAAIGNEKAYHREFFYTAGYDAPFKLFNRTNEIWFIAK